ncbi:MAG TPA: hypothetical protein VFB31_11560 [Pseudolabrys sp.]|nr:hypothetical protein [Pseudolabrys sp.]
MGKVLEAELRITGSDKTGGMWASVIAHAEEVKRRLAGMSGLGLNDAKMQAATAELRKQTSLLNAQNAAWRAINSTIALGNRELQSRAGLMARMAERFRGVMSGVGFLAGPGILMGTRRAISSGAEIQSERVKLRAAGVADDEIDRAERQAYGLAARYPNVGVASILERYKELRSVLLHPDEAPGMLPAVVQAQAAMKAIDHSGAMSQSLIYAVKAAEVMGLAQDPARFKSYLDAFIKAQQVMGKTITAEQQFDLATNFKAAAASLSDRFKTTTGISLAQEMRGMRAGVGVDQFIKQIVGGFQGSQHAAAKEFVAMGLANRDDFELTKTGEIKGFKSGRHVAGSDLAASDPDLWVYRYLLPALRAHGYVNQQDQINEVRRMFTSSRSADIVAKLIQQQQSFENHAKLYGGARGLDATDANRGDPFVALDSFTESLKNFAGTLTSPTMKDAAEMLSGWADRFGHLAARVKDWQGRHPDVAKAIGGAAVGGGLLTGGALTWGLFRGLFSGFGLKGSAAALTGSAAALNAAAVRLGAGGAASAATGGAIAAGEGAAIAGVRKTLGRGATVAAGLAALEAMKADSETPGNPLRTALRELFGIADDREPAPWAPGGAWNRRAEEMPASGFKRLDVEDIRRSLYGEPAKAEITGSADIRVRVEAGDGLIAKIEEVANRVGNYLHINGTMPSGTSGSTGPAMPESMPGAAGGP